MSRFVKILVLIIAIVVIAVVAFLGIHFTISGGELPIQSCTNCHTW